MMSLRSLCGALFGIENRRRLQMGDGGREVVRSGPLRGPDWRKEREAK